MYPARNGFCEVLFNQYDPHTLQAMKMELGLGIERFFLLTYCLTCCLPSYGARNNLRLVRQWPELEFVFPNEFSKETAIDNRYYIPGNAVPIDVDVNHRKGSLSSRVFVTVPRFDEGRPVTLGTVDSAGRIVPYPDYSWHDHQGSNCDGLTSVFRVAIDTCQRLWVMDTGKIKDSQVCPPQLLAFNLERDELVFRHKVDKENYNELSLFITPVVDVRDSCRDTFVYVADVSGFGLLVVDVAGGRSWRVTHRLFFPHPNRGTFTIDNESFDLMDGVLGMALSPVGVNSASGAGGGGGSGYPSGAGGSGYPSGAGGSAGAGGARGDRLLYFHALASVSENFVRTALLRNESFIHDHNVDPQDIESFPEERPSQSAAEAMDKDGILYFGLMNPPSIYCWNSATEFSPRNFHEVAVDNEALQFASGMKVVNNLKGEQELWVLTCSFQRVMTGSISSDRVNYRIHAEKIPNILSQSPCQMPPKGQRPGYHANRIMPKLNRRSGSYKYGAVSFL